MFVVSTVNLRSVTHLAFALLTASVVVASADQEAPRDRVTFTTFRPANWRIYLFDQKSDGPKPLTASAGLDYNPTISPDARWLVFSSERRGNPHLFVLDLLKGDEPRILIDSDAMEDQAAFAPDGKSVAFVSTASGNADLYLLPFNPERTAQIDEAENLTRSSSGEFHPAFSPDGKKLAFSSDRDGKVLAIAPIVRLRHGDIYVMDLADRSVRRLTNEPGWEGSPAWSADGSTIAYYQGEVRTAESWRQTLTKIWVMNADGTNKRVVTPAETTALSPEFLPDGRIMYSRKGATGEWQIVSTDLKSSPPRLESGESQLNYWKPARAGSGFSFVAHGTGAPAQTRTNATNSGPDFGGGPFVAEGKPVVRAIGDREIYLYPIRSFAAIVHPKLDLVLLLEPPGPSDISLCRLDGTERRTISAFDAEGGAFSSASWSRDGEWVALTRGRARRAEGESHTWKMRRDGSESVNLTANMRGNQSFPCFSGDGREIVFRGSDGGHFGLYTMNADGSNVHRLAIDAGDVIFPVWSPVSRQIAFLSNRDNPGVQLYEVYLLDLNPDDTQKSLRRITSDDVQEGHIAYSYDGKWLIFSSEIGGISDEEPLVQSVIFAPQMYGEMYAYRISDGRTVRLTHNKWEEGVPSWEMAVK